MLLWVRVGNRTDDVPVARWGEKTCPPRTNTDDPVSPTQLTSLSCAAGGTWVVYRNKELHSKPHLISWHAWLGTTALCFTGTAAALGLWTLWSRRRRPGRHVLAGVLTHCLAVAALAFGLETDYFAALVPTALWRRCFSALAFVSAAAVVAQTRRI